MTSTWSEILRDWSVSDPLRRIVPRVAVAVAVVGYDDASVAEWTRPMLTTVHQPIRRMAAEATRIVLRQADGERVEQQRLELATHLVVRESTAPPPA